MSYFRSANVLIGGLADKLSTKLSQVPICHLGGWQINPCKAYGDRNRAYLTPFSLQMLLNISMCQVPIIYNGWHIFGTSLRMS
jgi:hypothetical protein